MGSKHKLFAVLFLVILLCVCKTSYAKWPENGIDICTAEMNQACSQIIPDGTGGVIISWTDTRPGAFGLYAQRVNPGGNIKWAVNGVAVYSEQYADVRYPIMISDNARGAVIVWWGHRDDNLDIYAQRINRNGEIMWNSEGAPVCADPGIQRYPKMIYCTTGYMIVVWRDQRNGNEDIYAQKLDMTGQPRWVLNGVPVCNNPEHQSGQQIISDNNGGAIIVWTDYRNGVNNYDIYAQRINSTGDPLWTLDGIPICTAAVDQEYPQIAFDGDCAVVVWSDYRNGNKDIYAQRINMDGDLLWTEDGVGICTSIQGQIFPLIISDEQGFSIIAWEDGRGGVYAQRISSDGSIQWYEDGIPICIADGAQNGIRIISDGAGGAILAWRDRRSGDNWDLYTQKVNMNGEVEWLIDGISVSTALNTHGPVSQLSPDGSGGAYFVWEDDRYDEYNDIFVHHIFRNNPIAVETDEYIYDAATSTINYEKAINGTQNADCINRIYPNPFNPNTAILFVMAEPGTASIKIYDTGGRLVRTLFEETLIAGNHQKYWDGKDGNGNAVTSGVYFCRISTQSIVETKKMVLLR